MMQSYKTVLTVHAVPYSIVVAALLISVGLAALGWIGFALWLIAFLVMGAWLPAIVYAMRAIYRQYSWLALLFILLVAQTFHLIEHIAQMVELHLLGWTGPHASGLI